MSAKDIVLGAASGGAVAATPTYVDDVFSTYLFTTNGSNQNINNGIDLASKGGMVWFKRRDDIENNLLYSTNSGNKQLRSSTINAYITPSATNKDLVSYNNDGFTIGNGEYSGFSTVGQNYASWTFRKAAKFFDIVTWTGDGNTYPATRTLNHSLGIAPGMIVIKVTSAVDDWVVYHAGLPSPTATYLRLNTTEAARSGTIIDQVTSTSFRITDQLAYGADSLNQLNQTYVAYVFAHNTAADSMIKCGSFTTDGGGNATVNLGWEPQFVITKTLSASGAWYIADTSRGWLGGVRPTSNQILYANYSNAEVNSTVFLGNVTATGFNPAMDAGTTSIYMAIRRPNKPPTSGTQVFAPVAIIGGVTDKVAVTSSVNAPDTAFSFARGAPYSLGAQVRDRLASIGKSYIQLDGTGTEVNYSAYTNGFSNLQNGIDGANAGSTFNYSSTGTIYWMFKRAPGFFDVVCYTGTGSIRTVSHNLTVIPEIIIVKSRSATGQWEVYSSSITDKAIRLNTTAAQDSSIYSFGFGALPTISVFTVDGFSMGFPNTNASGITYVAYLFATLAGISKVGSYTGNGSSQTINCGFAAGARFILIKRTDAVGDWYVWDSARGIAAANDPHLSLNTTAAEVTTDDSIDPANTGFIVNQVAATNINVTSATYIFLAIA